MTSTFLTKRLGIALLAAGLVGAGGLAGTRPAEAGGYYGAGWDGYYGGGWGGYYGGGGYYGSAWGAYRPGYYAPGVGVATYSLPYATGYYGGGYIDTFYDDAPDCYLVWRRAVTYSGAIIARRVVVCY
jgi:hypothetical protein